MAEVKTITQRYMDAWNAVQNPPLDGANPHFNNRFATLKSTLREVRAACAANGLAYRQRLVGGRLLTCVMDAEGNEIPMSDLAIKEDAKSQEVGSDLTYRKRQLAQLDWGIVGEEDDDAEGGSDYAPVPVQQQPDALVDAWRRCLSLGVKGEGLEEHMRTAFGKQSLSQLSQAERMQMLQYLTGIAEDKERLMKGGAQ